MLLRPASGPRKVRAERPHPNDSAPDRARSKRPNLLFLITDDLRGGVLGIDGDPRRATPRLDALARQGVRFNRAYCNSPVCTPSRQSFITGRLPHATGVTRLATPLPETALTLGDLLGDHGYDTAAIGKMHFNSPSHHGFRERVDLRDWESWLAANPPPGGDRRRPWHPFRDPASVWLNAENRPVGLPAEAMDSTFLADQAIAYLGDHREEPFALVVSFYDPHSPFHYPEELAGRFRPQDFPVRPISATERRERPLVFQPLTDRDAQGIQAAYYTSVSFVDSQVGRVLDSVDKLGLADETLVVFLGDNGYMLGDHGRFEKHCFYEPAVRVPLIARWKDHLPADRAVNEMVELVDLFPTILDLLTIAAPPNLHGRSFLPLLKGEPGATGRDVVFSEYLENEEAMVRSSRYKLIVGTGHRKRLDGYETAHPLPGPYERLYDLQADPDEATDVADRPDLAGIKSELLLRLFDRLTSTRDGVSPPLPPGLSPIEAIHFCLVPRDPEPTPRLR